MSGLFVTSTSAAARHGAYGVLRTSPAVTVPVNTGIACIVDAFLWGPGAKLYQPSGVKDRIDTFAPFGSSHTTPAYLATIQKAFPQLWVVKVEPAAAAAASVTVASSAPANLATWTAKWKGGTVGNAISLTVSAGSNGVGTSFKYTFTLSGTSGQTSDVFDNVDISTNGAAVLAGIDFSKTKLIGSATWIANGTPATGTFTLSGGADGTPVASDFIGTAGTGDKGLAVTEATRAIAHIFYGDPGNSIRAACNAGMLSHVNAVSSRMGHITGNSGQSISSAQSDVANYRSYWLRYVDPWVQMLDDTTSAVQTVPGASFTASCAAQISPSTAISWKSPECTQFFAGIVGLEFDRGAAAPNNTAAGICTFINEDAGGVSIEADVVTNAPADPANKNSTRSQMALQIVKAWIGGARPSIDAPNVAYNQQPLVDALQNLLNQYVANSKNDPNHTPSINKGQIDSIAAFNSQVEIQSGQYVVPATVQTMAEMSFLFLSLNISTGVLTAKVNPNSP